MEEEFILDHSQMHGHQRSQQSIHSIQKNQQLTYHHKWGSNWYPLFHLQYTWVCLRNVLTYIC